MEKCKNRAKLIFCRVQAGLWLEASRQSLNEASPAEVPSDRFDDINNRAGVKCKSKAASCIH